MPAPPSPSERNLTWHRGAVERADREAGLGQRGGVIWLTGLSGSGKSTIADALDRSLHQQGRATYILDGDNVRHGLNADLGFGEADRVENIRRVGEVAALLVDAGLLVITAFISPYRNDRQRVRDRVPAERMIEIHVDAPLATCEARDPKGLYKRARAGEITNFTGLDAPYEPPHDPELRLNTAEQDVRACVARIHAELESRGWIPPLRRDTSASSAGGNGS